MISYPPVGGGPARLELVPLHTAARIATFHCPAPARCGAFADERRVVERRRRRTLYIYSFERRQTRRGSRFSSGFARLERERMMPSSHSARSSPPSVGLHPRVAACSSMSGAAWLATKATGAEAHPVPMAVGDRPACASLVASFTAAVGKLSVRTNIALSAPARPSPPSDAPRPRVAARSPRTFCCGALPSAAERACRRHH